MSSIYAHAPLQEKHSIRVIHLEPGSGDDTISCTLEPITLDSGVAYEALSYAWRDASDVRTIRCHGQELSITFSLFSALKQLRLPGTTRVLWADAICINQQDVEEKNQQVRMMAKIYSQPQRVLLWLGDNMEGLDGIKESLREVYDMLPPICFGADEIREQSMKFCTDLARRQRAGEKTLLDHDWRPINALLCKTWFTRKWIIQEVCMAPTETPRVLICGSIELSWDVLTSISFSINTYGLLWMSIGKSLIFGPAAREEARLAAGPNGSLSFVAITNTMLIRLIHHFTNGNLFDAVMAAYDFKCTEPRDHIYALVSLAERHQRQAGIHVDYNKSVEQLLLDFARWVVVHDQNPDFLGLAPTRDYAVHDEDLVVERYDLPSWVPDLASGSLATSIVSYTIREPVFHAGFPAQAALGTERAGPVPIYEQDGRLHIQGRIIDTIEDIADKPIIYIKQVFEREGSNDSQETPRDQYQERRRTKSRFESYLDVAFGTDGDHDKLWKKQSLERQREFAHTLMLGTCGLRDPVNEDTIDALIDYIDYVCDWFDGEEGHNLPEESWNRIVAYAGMIEWMTHAVVLDRRFCRMQSGRFGHVRYDAVPGDLICVFMGAQVPFTIRPCGNGDSYELIGDCYVSKVMHGETLVDERYQTVEIVLQ